MNDTEKKKQELKFKRNTKHTIGLTFDRNSLKNAMILVTFAIVLYWGLRHSEQPIAILKGLFSIISPFIVGLCIAFVVNVLMRLLENVWCRIWKKSKKKSRLGITTPNRHLFLLLFIFTFNLRSVQEHHQQCSILKNLYVVQCFQHEVRIHLRQRFCSIRVFYELLCSITFQ